MLVALRHHVRFHDKKVTRNLKNRIYRIISVQIFEDTFDSQ